MKTVTWKCDNCKVITTGEYLLSPWNIVVIKFWDETEAGYPDAHFKKLVKHFCTDYCRHKFLLRTE